ncbi:S8 family serine peptidase [Nonomuraea sp. MCN248]|uniref:S8 family serine peptidase n=1 Tax=Nonomuraea corallina TaxID=2989783 RepID=A0ABT4SEB3_9ACTN|nr:S8 family serine peptidase [Nonomuraea corallina]MDA0635315.1 S8 family serine peptidase [Nonomuraea corallina]
MGSRSALACALTLTTMLAAPAGYAGARDGAPEIVRGESSGDVSDGPPREVRRSARDGGRPKVGRGLAARVRAERRVRSIVELRPGHPMSGVVTDVERVSPGSRVLETPASAGFLVAEVDAAALAELRKDRRVRAVYADRLSVPFLAESTRVIGSDVANAAGWTGRGATVAVLDLGVDGDHPFLRGRIVDQACFSTTDPSIGAVSLCPNGRDTQTGPGAASSSIRRCMAGGVNECGHGTHVAGIAAGRFARGAPANGVAPGASILPVQVFSRLDSPAGCAQVGARTPCFVSYTSDQKLALQYVARVARTRNVASVNMSFGGSGPYERHCDADPEAAALKGEFDALVGLRVAPVVAAGNGARAGVTAPACVSSAVAVGATDDADRIAAFSNRGPLLDLFAPGVAITSSVPDDTYGTMSGTSMSAPHVAGAFAVMRQAYPGLDTARTLRRLQETGRPVPGGGSVRRLDVGRATTAAAPR